MKEAVRKIESTWLAGGAVALIAVAYFFFLGTGDFPEPGPNIEYDLKEFEDLDNVETQYVEKTAVSLGVTSPRALAVAGDKVFVAAENAVVVFGPGDKEVARYTVDGAPNCLAIADDGVLFAGMNTKVCVLDANGNLQGEWTDFTPRSFITSIAAHGQDVYVADAGKRTVSRFDRSGKRLTTIGEKDPARDVPGLEVPSPYLDVAVNEEGDLWVVNPGKLGLERYESDGTIVTSWYRPTVLKLDGFPGCCNPTHIAFNAKGELVTSEKGLVRVKVFDVTSGEFEGLIAGSELFPQEQSVRDLVVDSQDRVLVLDAKRNAIRVFARKESEDGPTSQPA